MNSADTMFKAIAHPIRREIIALLSSSDRSVKELTAQFKITQPAISQHLRELRDAKLVASERVGTERQYRLTGAPLQAVFEWSSQYRRFFDPAGHAWSFVAEGSAPRGR
jgi:DNA-binding transcriptional ArsR family regulator